MARPITILMFSFLFLNLWAGVLMSTGVAQTIGVDTAVGGDDALDTTRDRADDVESGAPTGSTLFGMYNVLAGGVAALTTITTAGPTMLQQAGVVPPVLGTMLKTIFSVVIAVGIISFLRGWDL